MLKAGPTSMPYNEFALEMIENHTQTICSCYPSENIVEQNVTHHDGNGTVFDTMLLLRTILARNVYDIIHVHSGHMGLILVLSLFPFNLKMLRHTVFTLHTSFHLLEIRNKILVIFTCLFVKATCACSFSSLQSFPVWLSKILKQKLVCIVNGYNDQRIEKLSLSSNYINLFSNHSGVKIVSVGHLNNNKNQVATLDAIQNTQEVKGEIVFLGDGPNRARLEKYATTMNADFRINFTGNVSREIAIQYMLEADIFISLSYGEGMPIAVLEAMGSGCISILSDISPHREIDLNQNVCFFVNPGDSISVSKLINKIVHMEKNQLTKLSQTTKQHVISNYSLNDMLGKYNNLYKSI